MFPALNFESMNSLVKCIRDFSVRALTPITGSGVAAPSSGGAVFWKHARGLAAAWEISGRDVGVPRGLLEDPWIRSKRNSATGMSSRGFHASAYKWQYGGFMGSDLRRLPRLLIVQPRVLPRAILKAKLMEAMRLVDSLEELRGPDAPLGMQEKRRQSPFVFVQSPRSNKRVSAGKLSVLEILQCQQVVLDHLLDVYFHA